jgi:branched-chain amino acid transport system permease protein
LGVGIFLENFTLALAPYPQHIPPLLDNITWTLGGVTFSSLQLLIIVLSLGLMFLLDYIVYRTPVGMAMRAISWDKTFVPLMGVPVDFIISITFAIGAGLAGAAGTMYGLAYPVIDPYMGIMVGWKAFIAAVVGGIGNIRGAVIGSFILGTVEIMVVAFFPSTYRDFVAFTLLLLLIVIRPYGILGKPRTQKV